VGEGVELKDFAGGGGKNRGMSPEGGTDFLRFQIKRRRRPTGRRGNVTGMRGGWGRENLRGKID